MKKLLITLCSIMLIAVSCEKNDMQPSSVSNTSGRPVDLTTAGIDRTNSVIHLMSIYYNGEMYTARIKELAPIDAANESNRSLRTIYLAPTLSPANGLNFWFYPVLDNMAGSTVNTPYLVKQVIYDSNICLPYQFTSSRDIVNAVSQPGSGISVQPMEKILVVTILTKINAEIE